MIIAIFVIKSVFESYKLFLRKVSKFMITFLEYFNLFEAFDPEIGATREISADELIDYINRIMIRKVNAKDRKFEKSDKKSKIADYLHMPHIHSSVAKRILVKTKGGETIDINKFAEMLSTRPDKILKQNSKMVKSGTSDTIFFNTSLPALKGLVVDENSGEFKIVNTCPSAGACQLVCYAKHGSYVLFPDVSLSQNKTLNYLFNDSQGFKDQMVAEINLARVKNRQKKVQIRWNDSGDLLSSKFFGIVMDIVNETPLVDHYIYTKEVQMIKSYPNPPDNVIFNFSYGAREQQEKLIDPKKDKVSYIVDTKKHPKNKNLPFISDFIYRDEKSDSWKYKSIIPVKDIIADHYKINPKTLLTIDELANTPKGKPLQYNVIVLPGESDLSASRRDVKGTYLIIH